VASVLLTPQRYAHEVSGRPARQLGASVVLAVIAGVVLCALVVIGAAANPLRAPIHEGQSTSLALGDAFFVLAVIAAIVGLVVMVFALFTLRSGPPPVAPAKKRRGIVALLLALLVAIALRSFIHNPVTSAPDRIPPAAVAPPTKEAPSSSHVWRDAGWVLVAVLGAAALGAAVVLRRYRDHSRDATETEDNNANIPGAVVDAVDAALDMLEAAGDPRQAIIAAYARMLEALEQRGLGCRPTETPRVHLARCLTAADVRPEPLEQLVRLFEEARFSTHPMTWEHRDEARRALGAVRRDLLVGAG
jgi:hypothetical protein